MRSPVFIRLPAFAFATALAFASCSQTAHHGTIPPNGGDPGAGTDDGGSNNGGGGQDASSIDPGGPSDQNCHDEKFVPMKVGDPDIILLQDTSGSMADGTPSKYDQVVAAVGDVITQLDQAMVNIEWGLVVFPSDNDCGVSNQLEVPVAAHDGAAIVNAIKGKQPGGNTPTHVAVNNAVAYYKQLNDNRGHYLLLATDGEPNCDSGNGGLPQTCQNNAQCPMGQTCMTIPLIGGICTSNGGEAVTAIQNAAKAGIKTFVVGIATGGQGDSAALDQMAIAGGTPRGKGAPYQYYDVSDQASLENAFKTITGLIISCNFAVQSLPMANQDIVVSVGNTQIPQDKTHMNGWDFDPNTKTLTFYGMACQQLQMHPDTVNVGYTCPPPS